MSTDRKVLIIGSFEALDRAVLDADYSVEDDGTDDGEAFVSLINSEMDDYRDSGALAWGGVELALPPRPGSIAGRAAQFILAAHAADEESVLHAPAYCVLTIEPERARYLLDRMDLARSLAESGLPELSYLALQSGLPDFIEATDAVARAAGQEQLDGRPVPAGRELTRAEIEEAQEDLRLESHEAHFRATAVEFRATDEHSGVEFYTGEIYRPQLEALLEVTGAAAS